MILTMVIVVVGLVTLGINRRLWLWLLSVLWIVSPVGVAAAMKFSPYTWFQLTGVFCERRRSSVITKTVFFRAMLAVAGLYVLAAWWSPESVQSLKTAFGVLVIALAFVTVCELAGGVSAIASMLGALSLPVLVQVASTVYFYFDGAAKADYYGSRIGKFFIGSVGQEAVYGDAQINGLSIGKSAGMFFTNGNRASMVMGVAGMVYLAAAIASRRRWPAVVALLCGVGVWASGSKTGIALLIVLPIFAILQASIANRSAGVNRLVVLPLSAILIAVGGASVWKFGQSYLAESDQSLSPRRALWETAFNGIKDNPLTGWGVGGWEIHWPQVAGSFGVRPTLPPHNFLLYAGTQGGLPMLVAQLVVTVGIAGFCMRGITRVVDRRQRMAIAFAAGAPLWALFHGQGDNTAFYGASNTVPLLAFAVVLCATIRGEFPDDDTMDADVRQSVTTADSTAQLTV
ncbi:O-antigen ligase family protein [Flexivirga sp. B27]